MSALSSSPDQNYQHHQGGIPSSSPSNNTKITLNDLDVLSGRGMENMHLHPGNVYFQTVVDRYYEEYANTPIQFRHIVTKKVMDIIVRRGGRFLKMEGSSGRLSMCDERSTSGRITKALRKRAYEMGIDIQNYYYSPTTVGNNNNNNSLTTTSSPNKQGISRIGGGIASPKSPSINDSDKKKRGSSVVPTKRSKRQKQTGHRRSSLGSSRASISSVPSSSDEENRSNTNKTNHNVSGNNNNDSDDDENTHGHYDHHHQQQSVWQPLGINNVRYIDETDALWNEQYRKLQIFYKKYGHTGVPPPPSNINSILSDDYHLVHNTTDADNNDNNNNTTDTPIFDISFQDWTVRQRQFYREIQLGYKIMTLQEETRWKQLQLLNFPISYQSWHWNYHYGQLQTFLEGQKYYDIDDSTKEKIPRKLKTWLQQQQKTLLNNGQTEVSTLYRLDLNKKERLAQIGVTGIGTTALD